MNCSGWNQKYSFLGLEASSSFLFQKSQNYLRTTPDYPKRILKKLNVSTIIHIYTTFSPCSNQSPFWVPYKGFIPIPQYNYTYVSLNFCIYLPTSTSIFLFIIEPILIEEDFLLYFKKSNGQYLRNIHMEQ